VDDSELIIARAAPIDGGVYACRYLGEIISSLITSLRATNEHETSEESVEISVEEAGELPSACVDTPELANCELVVRGQFCSVNEWYPKICCQSCTLAGQIVPDNDDGLGQEE